MKHRFLSFFILLLLAVLVGCGSNSQNWVSETNHLNIAENQSETEENQSDAEGEEPDLLQDEEDGKSEQTALSEARSESGDPEIALYFSDIEIPEEDSYFSADSWTMIHDVFFGAVKQSNIGYKLEAFTEKGYVCNMDLSQTLQSGEILDGVILKDDQNKLQVKLINISADAHTILDCYVFSVHMEAGSFKGSFMPGEYSMNEPVKAQIRQQFGEPLEEGEDYFIYPAVSQKDDIHFTIIGEKNQRLSFSDVISCKLDFDGEKLVGIGFEDINLTYHAIQDVKEQTEGYSDLTPSLIETLELLD